MQYAGRRPYGDIYVTPTTAADALSAKLYAEHQKEQQQQALELKGLDNMFVRNTLISTGGGFFKHQIS